MGDGDEPVSDAPAPLTPARTRPAPVALVALLTVGCVASALAGRWHPSLAERRPWEWEPSLPRDLPTRPPAPPFRPSLGRAANLTPWDVPSWLVPLLVGGVVLAALALIARRVRHRFRFPDGPAADGAGTRPGTALDPDLTTLRAGVDTAGGAVGDDDRPPADAVLAAWVSLEAAASRSGVARDPAQTPTEFTVAVLDRTPADRAATRDLLRLYLHARFGTDPLTAADVGTVRAALARLRATLGGAA